MSSPKKILIIRNDRLGDFMLAWPSFALLKKQYPDAELTALVPAYTQAIAEICPWIDKTIIDPQSSSSLQDIKQLVPRIKSEKFDASISLFSQTRIALALWLSRTPIRVAPATKIAQIFYNRKLTQRRSRSLKPEYKYNIDLINYFISNNGDDLVSAPLPPYLVFDDRELTSIKNNFLEDNKISDTKKLIFIHPGCGGSATNLSTSQYSDLIQNLANSNLHFVITTIYSSTKGIVEFSKILCISDLFISGSTGPLHLVAAANKNTAAFYPAHRSATLLRWQTVNTETHRLSFTHDTNKDMSSINAKDAARKISDKFLL